MRATGIIRRIDDLGRIVIPREIRHNLNLKDGSSLEFFIEKEGIVLVPYYVSAEDKIQALANGILKEVYELDNDKNETAIAELANQIVGLCVEKED